MSQRRPMLLFAAIIAIALAACTSGATPAASASPSAGASPSAATSPSTASAELIVFAAASLKNVLADAKKAYEVDNPGVTLAISTDASSALATQIQQGAPCDVFLSADTKNPQTLADAGLTTGPPVPFAGNVLTVITPTDNPGKISSPKDLADPGVKIVAAGDAVPITKYANMTVANLAKLPGYPPDFVAAYNANVVSQEQNVAGIVSKLELGDGDAGIVYVTDAKASTKVASVKIPDEANVPATYTGVVVKETKEVDASTAFLTWLAGPDGQAILAGYGFLSPSA